MILEGKCDYAHTYKKKVKPSEFPKSPNVQRPMNWKHIIPRLKYKNKII